MKDEIHNVFFRVQNLNKEFIEDVIKASLRHGVDIVPTGSEPYIKVRKEM